MSADDDRLRSPLGRALGLGSAKEGVAHWWAQRVTAVALVPLVLWFVIAMVAHIGADRTQVLLWLHRPRVAIGFILLLVALFYHMALGLQVVIEDYIHNDWVKLPALLLNKAVCIVFALAGILAVLRLALGV